MNDTTIDTNELNELKKKADKWDKLGKKVDSFYVDDNGDLLDDNEGGDLLDIGLACAEAFDYL